MKKLGIVVLMFLLAVTAGIAQNQGGRNLDPEEMAKRQTDRLKEVLDLNKDQEKKVHDLNLETSKKMRELRDQNQGDFSAMRDKMGAIRDEQNKKMKTILTEEQWPKYEKYLEERANARRQGGGGYGPR